MNGRASARWQDDRSSRPPGNNGLADGSGVSVSGRVTIRRSASKSGEKDSIDAARQEMLPVKLVEMLIVRE